jgi:hypothetical protein
MKNKKMNLPEDVQLATPIRRQSSVVPRVGELGQVRSRLSRKSQNLKQPRGLAVELRTVRRLP